MFLLLKPHAPLRRSETTYTGFPGMNLTHIRCSRKGKLQKKTHTSISVKSYFKTGKLTGMAMLTNAVSVNI